MISEEPKTKTVFYSEVTTDHLTSRPALKVLIGMLDFFHGQHGTIVPQKELLQASRGKPDLRDPALREMLDDVQRTAGPGIRMVEKNLTKWPMGWVMITIRREWSKGYLADITVGQLAHLRGYRYWLLPMPAVTWGIVSERKMKRVLFEVRDYRFPSANIAQEIALNSPVLREETCDVS